MALRRTSRRRPELPGRVKENEVCFVVRNENPTLLGSEKKLLLVARALEAEVARRYRMMVRRPEQGTDSDINVVVEVKGGHPGIQAAFAAIRASMVL